MRGWFVFVLAACGDNTRAAESPDPTSGSRLQVTYYAYDDGTLQPVPDRFFDRAILRHCTPSTWSDGLTYCTPSGGSTLFTDPSCVDEVGVIAAGLDRPAYLIRYFVDHGVVGPSRLFITGAPRERPPALFERIDGECRSKSVVPPSYDYFFDVGADLGHDYLARLDRSELPTGSRVAIQMLGSDDGMRLPVGLVDQDLGPCAVDETLTGPTPCRPIATTPAEYFYDEACTQPEVEISGPAPGMVVSVASEDTGCTRYFDVGVHVGPVPLYQRVAGACVMENSFSGNLFLTSDERVPATVEIEHRVGSGSRLEPIFIEVGGVRMLGSTLFDRELGATCRFGQRQGTSACLPARANVGIDLFTDAGCSLHASVAEVPSRRCDSSIVFADDREVGLFRLGAATGVYALTSDGCMPYLPPGHVMREVGEAIPVSSLVTADQVDEP